MSETTIAPIAGVTAGPASNDPVRQPEAAHRAMAAMPLGEWARRLGALPAEAYDCFMVGTLYGFNRIQAWFARDCSWPMAGSPRIIAWRTSRSRAACRRARVGKGQAFGGAEKAPSLTIAARDGDGKYAVGDGRMLAARVEQKNEATARQKVA